MLAKFVLFALGTFMISGSIFGQTPSINTPNGVVESSTYTEPLYHDTDWSIFGTSLSTGSGSQAYVNLNTYYTSEFESGSTDWYESATQINFYAALNSGDAKIYVCNSLSNCSNNFTCGGSYCVVD